MATTDAKATQTVTPRYTRARGWVLGEKMISSEQAKALLDAAQESATTAQVEIAYRIPGKGAWKRKTFKGQAAMERWVQKLIQREGDDVEIRHAQN